MIADWIKQRRLELKLSQEEFAASLQLEGLDASRTAVSSWETGRYFPPIEDRESRQAMARALKVSVEDLLSAAGFEIDAAEISDAARRAASIVNHLPPEKQTLAIDLLLALEKH